MRLPIQTKLAEKREIATRDAIRAEVVAKHERALVRRNQQRLFDPAANRERMGREAPRYEASKCGSAKPAWFARSALTAWPCYSHRPASGHLGLQTVAPARTGVQGRQLHTRACM